MSGSTVYLAGPITGFSYDGCTEWRTATIAELAAAGIKGLDPMRGKEYLSHVQELTADGNKYGELYGVSHVMSLNRGIMTRDHFDATRCTAMLANLLGATKPSVGTIMEMAWAHTHQIPLVAVMEPEGNPHEHGMILEAIGFRVATLPEAIHVLKAMLS